MNGTLQILVMGRIDPRENGKMGLAALLFVFGFDIISGAIGVIVAILIKPGGFLIEKAISSQYTLHSLIGFISY